MTWIEVHQALWSHRKTYALADALHLAPGYAAAHLLQLWSWSIDNAPQGELTGISASTISRAAAWPRAPAPFVDALVAAGWLDRDGERLTIHDWWEYAGRLIERRMADRERSRDRRPPDVHRTSGGRPPDVRWTTGGQPPDDQRTTGGQPPDNRRTSAGTVPYRTGPYQTAVPDQTNTSTLMVQAAAAEMAQDFHAGVTSPPPNRAPARAAAAAVARARDIDELVAEFAPQLEGAELVRRSLAKAQGPPYHLRSAARLRQWLEDDVRQKGEAHGTTQSIAHPGSDPLDYYSSFGRPAPDAVAD